MSIDGRNPNPTLDEEIASKAWTFFSTHHSPRIELGVQIPHVSETSQAKLYCHATDKVAKVLPKTILTDDPTQALSLVKEYLCWKRLHCLSIPANLKNSVYQIESGFEITCGLRECTCAQSEYTHFLVLTQPALTCTLSEYVKNNSTKKDVSAEVKHVLETVAKLYAFLHSEVGFVHGDFHADNVMLYNDNGNWLVTFIDFANCTMEISDCEWKAVSDLLLPWYNHKPFSDFEALLSSLHNVVLPEQVLRGADMYDTFVRYKAPLDADKLAEKLLTLEQNNLAILVQQFAKNMANVFNAKDPTMECICNTLTNAEDIADKLNNVGFVDDARLMDEMAHMLQDLRDELIMLQDLHMQHKAKQRRIDY